MAELWKPQPIEVYKDWHMAIEMEAADELSEWEMNFINDIGMKLDNGWPLTKRQAEVLERIYAEKTK